ncbi:hypothetical protein ACWEN3_28075 [Streptomyces sp. NPDC004561]
MPIEVRSVTADGMHEVVSVTDLRADGVRVPAALSPAQLALVRSVVRGELDLRGHASGETVAEVVLGPNGARLLSCRPREQV